MSDITQRIDAVTKIGDLRISMNGIQPAPKSVKVELTARCCLKCKYCAVRTRKEQPTEDMDFYFFQRITEDMRYSGVEEIGVFYLGESFMNPNLLTDAIAWCKKIGFPYVFLTSNAVMAKPLFVRGVMDAGLDSLKWSVNFADTAQFKELTCGTQEQFEQVFSNIKTAWDLRTKHGFKTMLSASSIRYGGEQEGAMENLLIEKVKPYVDRHYWLPLYQMSMYKDRIEKEMGYTPTAGNMGRLDDITMTPNRKPLPCWSAFTEGHVRVNGSLSACCFGADDRFDMGLLDGTNFMRQWNSPKFQHLRKAQLRTLTEGQDALKGTVCEVCVGYE